jgi:CHAD domain-containing protein
MKRSSRKPCSAGDVLWDYLREHAERLAARDAEVRAGEPDGIHQMRVESRRLRTAVAVYRPLLDAEQARELQAELRWLARTLSPARDLEVVEGHLNDAISAEPRTLTAGPVRMLPKRRLREAATPARAAALAVLDQPRYLALRERLDAFVADPPWSEKAAKPATNALPKRLAKPWRRIRNRVETAEAAEPRDRDAALHEVRKAAKRMRYACDVAAPELGADVERLSRKAEQIQDILGHHQDMVVLRQWLRRLSRDPEAGQAAFTFGRAHRRAEELAAQDFADYEPAWDRLRKRASDLLPTE